MKCVLTVFFILSVFLSGCVLSDEQLNTSFATDCTEESVTIPTESMAAEETTEPTAPPDLLGIEAGSHLLKFTDPNSGAFFEYYAFIPHNAVKNMPLILFLHGDGEIGKINALENIALVENAKAIYGEEFPFIAIAPCRRQKSWCTGSSPKTLIALLDEAVHTYEIDPDHVIITGFSSGAMGTWYMITNHTEHFSAAVPISCPNEYPIVYNNIKNIPIWGFVGGKEEYYTKKMTEIINWTAEIGGDAKLTVLEDMSHQGMDKASYTRDVIDWMIAQ